VKFPKLKFARVPLLQDGLILGLLWGLLLICDVAWLRLDHSVPAWDQGDHLSRALNHWRVLQSPRWLDGEWWRTLWQQAPTQRAPLVYLSTVPWFNRLGRGFDQGIAVNLGFSLILLGSVYLTGRRLFSRRVGLWAAGMALLSPVLVGLRLDYLLDYGMTAVFAAAFAALTYWWMADRTAQQWGLAILSGVGLGGCILTRTSALLFLIPLLIWVTGRSLWRRQWQRIGQIGLMLAVGLGLIWPWFSTSWLTIISTTLESTSHGVTLRHDPQANSLAGWLYYPSVLPEMVSWPILLTAVGLGSVHLLQRFWPGQGRSVPAAATDARRRGNVWLAAVLIGVYILGVLGSNKQPRILVPALPVLLVAFAQVFHWRDRPWQRWLRWGAVSLSTVCILFLLFPLPRPALVDRVIGLHKWPYQGMPWPNQAVIQAMVQADPWLKLNLGMAADTAELNPHNMDFYGALADFQVNSRRLGARPETAETDVQALNWYLTKTGNQNSDGTVTDGQTRFQALVGQAADLSVYQQWPLPDESLLTLHRRQGYPIAVTPLSQSLAAVSIEAVETPSTLIAGQASPVTYRIRGPWSQLTQGALLLTWRLVAPAATPEQIWVADQGIGLGQLYAAAAPAQAGFELLERVALLPPADAPLGTYRLEAVYLNRQTGETMPLTLPETQVSLVAAAPEAAAPASSAPRIDLVTQLRQLSAGLATGEIDPIFTTVDRINQYDAEQDYLVQTEQLMRQRLQTDPDNVNWLYPLILAQVLQQDAPGAIATLEHLTQVAPNNPYHWAYLGFVQLYSWHPQRAQAALDQAAARQPDLPNLKELQLAAAVMRLDLGQAWRLYNTLT
jgi:4-amino-4-deoxy-L-arabinose transferase-like glycosyltransferase